MSSALDDVMKWAWKQVIKPHPEKHANFIDRNLGMLDEEMLLWEKIKESNRVLNACLRAVEHESVMFTVFEQKRAAVATALRNLCENDMKDICLRPLLVHMGILDEYECEVAAGHRKIDVVGTDTALGQHYRRGIVEYFGVSNVDEFLMHVANTAEAVQDANIAGVFDFVALVREARENALVVDAGESVLVREPFQDFLKLVYPCYLNALSSHGYFLSDLELLLLCECARLNAVIGRQIRHEHEFGRTVFKVHKYVLPAGDFAAIIIVAIRADLGRSAVRGHYKRLECLTRAAPSLPVPPSSSGNAKTSDVNRGSPVVPTLLHPYPAGASGRSSMGGDAEQKNHQAIGELGTWARNASDGCKIVFHFFSGGSRRVCVECL